MSIVTPDDPNRKERQRVVSIDIESIPDPTWVDMKAEQLEPFDLGRYMAGLKRPDMDALLTGMGGDPGAFKNMGDLGQEIRRTWELAIKDPDATGHATALGLEDHHHAAALDDIMGHAVGLRAMASQVVAIGVVSYYGDAEDPDPERTFAVAGDDEPELIRAIYDVVDGADLLTGFNLVGYDGPMLRWRACLHEVGIPKLLWRFRRYSDYPQCDTMFELGNWDPRPRGTLEEWCWRFGVSAPAKTDWREIIAWYQAGDWEALKTHVLQDAMAAGELYQRIRPSLHRQV